MENFDSKIQPFGFYYCPFSLVGRVGDEFCNTFALSHTFEAMLALFWKECEWIIIVRDAFRRLE
jgi:hypothetical protein